ncbi:hypothetical protein [Pelagibius sp.]
MLDEENFSESRLTGKTGLKGWRHKKEVPQERITGGILGGEAASDG